MPTDLDAIVESWRSFTASSWRLLRDVVSSEAVYSTRVVDAVVAALAQLPSNLCDDEEIAKLLDDLVSDETIQTVADLWIRVGYVLGWADVQRGTERCLRRAFYISGRARQLVGHDKRTLWTFQIMAADSLWLLSARSGQSTSSPITLYEAALEAIPRETYPDIWVVAAERLGNAYFAQVDSSEDRRRGETLLREAWAEMQRLGDRQGTSRVLATLGRVDVSDGTAAESQLLSTQMRFEISKSILGNLKAGDASSPAPPAEEKPAASTDAVFFTAYYPRTCIPGRRYAFVVYSHLPQLLSAVKADARKFSSELGGELPKPRTTKEGVRLKPGSQVMVIPECDSCRFDPPEQTKEWDGTWTRFPFDFKPSEALTNETIVVDVSIQIAGIEIASIKNCAIEIESANAVNVAQNPLAEAKAALRTATLHQRIFVSYSRADSEARNRYLFGQHAVGNETFVDVDNLRAGQNWKAALAGAIDHADVFQLLWSKHSAASEYCKYEWQYAHQSRSPDNVSEGFIRAAYWEKPMPTPPEELKDLNFRFVPISE